jgi:hypothetical protein
VPLDILSFEDDALPLAKGPEYAPFERPGTEVHLAAIVVSNNDPGARARIESLDYALHRGQV